MCRRDDELGEYLLAHVAVEGDGENCAPIDQGYDIGPSIRS
jgi:hypothetical protein